MSGISLPYLGYDTGVRANQSGFGTASDGNTYTQMRGTQLLSIVSNECTVTYNGSTTTGVVALSTNTAANAEGEVRFKVGNLTDLAGIGLRVKDANNFYSCIVGNTSQTLTFRKDVANVFSTVGTAISFTYTVGTFYRLRFFLSGSSLNAKIWADGSAEPQNWMMTASDSSLTGAGRFGLVATPVAGPSADSFDSFSVRNLSTIGRAHTSIGRVY